MFERFTQGARLAVFHAREEALKDGAALIEPAHLLRSLEREDSEGTARFIAEHPTIERLRRMKSEPGPPADPNNMKLSERGRLALTWAAESSYNEQCSVIGPTHLLAGLLRVAENPDWKPPARISLRERVACIVQWARGVR